MGYDWRHGWIPLSPSAFRSKNHGHKPGSNSKLGRKQAGHSRGSRPLFNDQHVLRSMSDERLNASIDWGNDASVEKYLPEMNRRENAAKAKRDATERRRAQLARQKEEHYLAVHQSYLNAEAATNGYMLSREGAAAGINPISLFTGPQSRVDKYASEELRKYFDEHGGRLTVTEYRKHAASERASYEAADRARAARTRMKTKHLAKKRPAVRPETPKPAPRPRTKTSHLAKKRPIPRVATA